VTRHSIAKPMPRARSQSSNATALTAPSADAAPHVSPLLRRRFRVFRTRRTIHDRLPTPTAVATMRAAQLGENVAYSRFAGIVGRGNAVFLVPATNGLCLYEASGGGGCTAEWHAEKLVGVLTCDAALAPDDLRLIGVLPDKARRPRVLLRDGEQIQAHVGANAYWYEGTRTRTLPVAVLMRPDGRRLRIAIVVTSEAQRSSCSDPDRLDARRAALPFGGPIG
jgi:hypothetical protein